MKVISLLAGLLISYCAVFCQSTRIRFLSGKDKDHTVPWNFFCTSGMNSGKWTKIPVPSNWELQGFGNYNYGHDKVKSSEEGLYACSFATPDPKGNRIFIVFEGVMTDAEVKINGSLAGPVHQGGFYRFKYDITSLLKPEGNNLLEVHVKKTSADSSVNQAERNGDFWLFGGIYRPVYLEIVPAIFIDRVAVDAKADGSFQLDVFPENLRGGETIEAQVEKSTGERVGSPFIIKTVAGQEKFQLKSHFDHPRLWSAEFPNLYQVLVTLKNKNGIIHQIRQKFGFRTIGLRTHDGLYVNGARILLKGVNRHSFWPESGRTLSRSVHLLDIRLMKEMNMNAVRMSHYPPDAEFLDLCDSLGLYVLDELTGWQAKYDTVVGRKLVKEMVLRDVNHPSIIFWDNGNEGGWNRGLDNDFPLYDPQKRTVIHPWERFNGTNTKHYPDYSYIEKSVATENDVFFPTEFMHGLYDGGAGAALDDFWNLMLKHPHGAGGFIWALLDESVLRTDKQGIYDGDGNHAPDGIVGPHREKEASFYTIKEIWSPVYISPPVTDENFDGRIEVTNRYSFTDLKQCRFTWKLLKFPSPEQNEIAGKTLSEGSLPAFKLSPGKKAWINLHLPPSWRQADALYLTADGPDQKEICTWSWAISGLSIKRKAPVQGSAYTSVKTNETDSMLIVECDHIKYYFSKITGYIQKVVTPKTQVSLSGGPVVAGLYTTMKKFAVKASDSLFSIETDYDGEASLQAKWTFASGRPVRLDYRYTQSGDVDFSGISFNYPEEKMTGIKWLGRGPYRVWKNRMKGQQFGVWHKAYNDAVTGEVWNYPEFKGYHAEVRWVVIGNQQSSFTVFTDSENLFLQVLHPKRENAALANDNVEPPFPAGDIGFLDAIPAIGTKFQAAKVMGPQSQKNHSDGKAISGTLWFRF